MNTAEQPCKRWFFPLKHISQVPIEQLRRQLIKVFERWGKPGAMRVDNGHPLGVPTQDATPALALWLIAMDVDMIWNKPRCPKMNARVEKMQDTTARWAEIKKTANAPSLQQSLDQAVKVQREQYPVVRLKGKTRQQAFEGLATNQRPYDPSHFNIQRVYDFLHKKLYTRKVSAGGQIKQFGEFYTIGYPYRGKWVQLRLTADGKYWQVFADYQLIKELPAHNLTEEHVQNLTVIQRTNYKT